MCWSMDYAWGLLNFFCLFFISPQTDTLVLVQPLENRAWRVRTDSLAKSVRDAISWKQHSSAKVCMLCKYMHYVWLGSYKCMPLSLGMVDVFMTVNRVLFSCCCVMLTKHTFISMVVIHILVCANLCRSSRMNGNGWAQLGMHLARHQRISS